MRLWHIDMIPYLPKSQLVAQWRELNSIFKKQDNHILINYIYNYPKKDLCLYANIVQNEMFERGYKINKHELYEEYFKGEPWIAESVYKPFANEHNNEYLTICYWNLREKYLRGQKDFTDEVWERLDRFYKNKIKGDRQ